LVERSLAGGSVSRLHGGDENEATVGHAFHEATGRTASKSKGKKDHLSDHEAVVLGSGNLGLVYLMEESRRMTLEEIEGRHPRLLPALREHPRIGFLLVHPAEHGPVVLGARGANYLASGASTARIRWPGFPPTLPRTCAVSFPRPPSQWSARSPYTTLSPAGVGSLREMRVG
jgi:hypothetical protein